MKQKLIKKKKFVNQITIIHVYIFNYYRFIDIIDLSQLKIHD